MCDDAVTSLSIAEVGKWDQHLGQWVTAQPYQVGVLLSSSNASTWTPHQDRDLTFRLLRAVFDPTPITVELGAASVEKATDLMLMALADQPSAAARIEYQLALPDESRLNVAESGRPTPWGNLCACLNRSPARLLWPRKSAGRNSFRRCSIPVCNW